MDEPIPIFENKFLNYIKQIEEDNKAINEHLKMIADGKIRAGYFNNISDSIIRMQQTISAIKNLSIKKELIGLEIKNRLSKILAAAIEQAKAEAKQTDDPLGLQDI